MIKIGQGNVGASHLVTKNDSLDDSLEEVQAVLLSDVLDEVYEETADPREKISIVIKMDIERYECRAMLGSPG